MRAAILTICLLITAGAAGAELLQAIAVVNTGENFYMVYEDNQVWRWGGSPYHLEQVDRGGIAIRDVKRWSTGDALALLYEDEQVWSAGIQSFEFVVDAHRDGTQILYMDAGHAPQIVCTYTDGQVWIWTTGVWSREQSMEREDPGGACCQPDGTCIVATEANCQAPGVWQGWGTDCDPNPCVVGACCHLTYCDRMSEAQCVGYGGVFMGPGSFCEPNPCVSSAEDELAPAGLRLSAVPNPSTGQAMIRYSLPKATTVSIEVFDAAGGLVRRLMEGNRPAGSYSTRWDGRDESGRELPTGVYFARIVTTMGTTTGRVVLTK